MSEAHDAPDPTKDNDPQSGEAPATGGASEAVSGLEQEESGAGYGNNAGEQGSEAERGR